MDTIPYVYKDFFKRKYEEEIFLYPMGCYSLYLPGDKNVWGFFFLFSTIFRYLSFVLVTIK